MPYNRSQDKLFAEARLFDALEAHSRSISQRVQTIAESVLRASDDEQLVGQLIDELSIEALTLNLARQSMTRQEVQIDVTGDPRRVGYLDGRPILVAGIRVVISIPFQGDRELWKLTPSTYQLSAPWGTVRSQPGKRSGTLELIIEQPTDQPLEQIKAELDRRLGDITFFIESQKKDLAGYAARLRQEIANAIADRRARLKKHDGLAALLGIPELSTPSGQAHSATVAPRGSARTAAPTSVAQPVAWDAFVSHASEDKETFVRPLVAALEAAGLRIWFDESTLRVGDSLRRSIDRGLANSRFGVVVISKHFLSKQWPQRELDGLIAREDDGRKVVLPVWHEISAAEVRQASPTLADRLAVTSAKGVEAVAVELLKVLRDT